MSGAIHHLPREFGSAKIRSMVEAAKQRRRECNNGISNPRCFLIVYGTGEEDEKSVWATAYRLRNDIRRMGEGGEVVVKILKGGLDSWIRVIDGSHSIGGIGARTPKMTGIVDAARRDCLKYQYKC